MATLIPTPIAGPLTAAITGFGSSLIVLITTASFFGTY